MSKGVPAKKHLLTGQNKHFIKEMVLSYTDGLSIRKTSIHDSQFRNALQICRTALQAMRDERVMLIGLHAQTARAHTIKIFSSYGNQGDLLTQDFPGFFSKRNCGNESSRLE